MTIIDRSQNNPHPSTLTTRQLKMRLQQQAFTQINLMMMRGFITFEAQEKYERLLLRALKKDLIQEEIGVNKKFTLLITHKNYLFLMIRTHQLLHDMDLITQGAQRTLTRYIKQLFIVEPYVTLLRDASPMVTRITLDDKRIL